MTRIEKIRTALQALQPTRLELEDESRKHAGHAGARTGRGHFKLTIVSPMFAGLAPIARHRKVYETLGELMQTDIHALAIEARTDNEPPR